MEALPTAQGLVAASQENAGGAGVGQMREGGARNFDLNYHLNQYKGKGKAVQEEDSEPYSSDSDEEAIDPSVRIAKAIVRAERRGQSIDTHHAQQSIRISSDACSARTTGPRSLNKLRRRLQMRCDNGSEVGVNNRFHVRRSCDAAWLRSKGEHLRAELSEIEAQAKTDIQYAREHGIIRTKEAAANNAADGGGDGKKDEEMSDRVRILAAATIAVVEQAMDNPEMFEDIFDQARGVLSGLGVHGHDIDSSTEELAISKHISSEKDDCDLNWEQLENESEEYMVNDNRHLGGQATRSANYYQHYTGAGKHWDDMNNKSGTLIVAHHDSTPAGQATQCDGVMSVGRNQHGMPQEEGMLVVGSARQGDDADKDPPFNGPILVGWHDKEDEGDYNCLSSHFQETVVSYLHNCDAEQRCQTNGYTYAAIDEVPVAQDVAPEDNIVPRESQTTRPHVLDVETNCRPGPSFRRDDGGKC